MSLKSYFRKDHKYKTQADLKDMTADEIVAIKPSDIGFYIENETGGIPLTGVEAQALWNVLDQKKREKKTGIIENEDDREKRIERFLSHWGVVPRKNTSKQIWKMIPWGNSKWDVYERSILMKEWEKAVKREREEREKEEEEAAKKKQREREERDKEDDKDVELLLSNVKTKPIAKQPEDQSIFRMQRTSQQVYPESMMPISPKVYPEGGKRKRTTRKRKATRRRNTKSKRRYSKK